MYLSVDFVSILAVWISGVSFEKMRMHIILKMENTSLKNNFLRYAV